MPTPRTLTGEMTNTREPVWLPLERVVSPREIGDFMVMNDVVLADGTRVHAYKHRETRRYVHLSDDGRAFVYTADGRYRETPILGAVEDALPTDGRRAERFLRDGVGDGTPGDSVAMWIGVPLTDGESVTLAAYAHPRGLGYHQGLRELVTVGFASLTRTDEAPV